MDSAIFEGLIKDMCGAAGLVDWKEVVRSGHMSVDERVVGLLHRAQDANDEGLSIYVEFDPVDPHDPHDPQFCGRLLRENVTPTEGLDGFFGVHPDTGKVVYCVRMAGASRLSGESLAAYVEGQVRDAAGVLKTLAH
jgi:hypothetical protein